MKQRLKEPLLGILMLDTQFPRILGDAGNPDSYPFPVEIMTVKNAGSTDVVKDGCLPPDICEKFINAAIKLEGNGASAIISTCGFLITEQQKIADAVNIPVMVSALSLYKKIKKDIGDKRILIITASKPSLGSSALKAADILEADIHVMGMEKCDAIAKVILQKKEDQSLDLDTETIEHFIISELENLCNAHPELCAILLECGNLPPYIDVIKSTTGLPVYSILDGADMVMSIV